jgi:hypothetical protein
MAAPNIFESSKSVSYISTPAYRILNFSPEFEKFAHPCSVLLISWPVWNPGRRGMCALQDKGKPVSLIRQTEWVAGWNGNNFSRHCHARKLNGDRLLFGQTGQSCRWVFHYTHARTGAVRPDSNPLPISIGETEIRLKKSTVQRHIIEWPLRRDGRNMWLNAWRRFLRWPDWISTSIPTSQKT